MLVVCSSKRKQFNSTQKLISSNESRAGLVGVQNKCWSFCACDISGHLGWHKIVLDHKYFTTHGYGKQSPSGLFVWFAYELPC